MADMKALQEQLNSLKQQRNQIIGITSQTSPAGIARRAGIRGPISKTTKGQLTGAAIGETKPSEIRSAEAMATAKELAGPFLEEGKSQISSVTASPSGITVKFEQGPEAKIAEQQASADIEVNKQVKAQKQKDISDTRQDLTNARLKIGTAFDSWLNVIDRTKRLTGVDPGIFGGAITEVLGKTKANEFVNAFKGGLVEYAAAVGRISMPGARATRLINLFKQTAPTTFDTVPSAIEQSGLSFRNGLSTSMSREPESFLPDFTGSDEDFNKLDVMLRDFQNTYREGLMKLAFDKNPELVPADIRRRLESESRGEIVADVSDDDINALLDRLGG